MKKLRFLVSLTTDDNDYQIEQAQSAEEAARKFGVELRVIYADNDAITQSTQLLKAIQAEEAHRPDAIIFEPVGGTALPQVARAAASSGIGWAVLNRDASYIPELRKSSSAPVFVLTSDHLEIGRIQGRQIATLVPRGGSILCIQGPAENSAAKDRTAGRQETKPANVHPTLLRGQWTEESSQKAVRSWLKLTTSRKAAMDLIAAQDDSMFLEGFARADGHGVILGSDEVAGGSPLRVDAHHLAQRPQRRMRCPGWLHGHRRAQSLRGTARRNRERALAPLAVPRVRWSAQDRPGLG